MSKSQDELINELREKLKPGTTLYTVLRHVSRSGMSRVIQVKSINGDDVRQYDYAIQELCGYKMHDYDGNKIGGAGMDMGFQMVYQFSQALYPNGFDCIGEDCPSNDHSNGDRDYTPHHHNAGGYALKQRWL